ncbi:hypothetical protein ACVR1I_06535 [Streptococcus cameli]
MKLKELLNVIDEGVSVEYWHKGYMVYASKTSDDPFLEKTITWMGLHRDGGLLVDFKEVE